jgi:hypothetical protein
MKTLSVLLVVLMALPLVAGTKSSKRKKREVVSKKLIKPSAKCDKNGNCEILAFPIPRGDQMMAMKVKDRAKFIKNMRDLYLELESKKPVQISNNGWLENLLKSNLANAKGGKDDLCRHFGYFYKPYQCDKQGSTDCHLQCDGQWQNEKMACPTSTNKIRCRESLYGKDVCALLHVGLKNCAENAKSPTELAQNFNEESRDSWDTMARDIAENCPSGHDDITCVQLHSRLAEFGISETDKRIDQRRLALRPRPEGETEPEERSPEGNSEVKVSVDGGEVKVGDVSFGKIPPKGEEQAKAVSTPGGNKITPRFFKCDGASYRGLVEEDTCNHNFLLDSRFVNPKIKTEKTTAYYGVKASVLHRLVCTNEDLNPSSSEIPDEQEGVLFNELKAAGDQWDALEAALNKEKAELSKNPKDTPFKNDIICQLKYVKYARETFARCIAESLERRAAKEDVESPKRVNMSWRRGWVKFSAPRALRVPEEGLKYYESSIFSSAHFLGSNLSSMGVNDICQVKDFEKSYGKFDAAYKRMEKMNYNDILVPKRGVVKGGAK